jgi:hypothetical protein
VRRALLIALTGSLLAAAPASGAELLGDGSFEAAVVGNSPSWVEADNGAMGSPICGPICGDGGGTAGPRTGTSWAWFGGGLAGVHTSSLAQTVTIPAGTATFSFFLRIGLAGDGDETLTAKIDSTPLFAATGLTPGFAGYAPVTMNASAFANGGAHTVRLEYTNAAGIDPNLNVDDVSLSHTPPAVAATTPVTPAKKCKRKKGKSAGAAKKKKCKKRKKK